MFLFFLFIGITHLLFEVSCMYVCYLLFPMNNNNNNNNNNIQIRRKRKYTEDIVSVI